MISVLAFSGVRARAGQGVQRLIFRCQTYLLVPMLFLEAVSLHASSIRTVAGPGCRHRAWEATLLGAHLAAYLGAVFLVLPPVKALTFILVQQGLLGFYLGCSFASMPRPNQRRAQSLVAVFCAERDVSYTETSLLASYAQALGHLAAVGSELASPLAASKAVPVPARC
jgi:hypothetical protein